MKQVCRDAEVLVANLVHWRIPILVSNERLASFKVETARFLARSGSYMEVRFSGSGVARR